MVWSCKVDQVRWLKKEQNFMMLYFIISSNLLLSAVGEISPLIEYHMTTPGRNTKVPLKRIQLSVVFPKSKSYCNGRTLCTGHTLY